MPERFIRFNLQSAIVFRMLAKGYLSVTVLLHFCYKSITFIDKSNFIPVKDS